MEILLNASTCGFFGLGGSNAVALIAFHKFLRMPLHCVYHQDFHFQQMQAAKLTSDDCAFVISHTGKNRDTMHLVEILKSRGVPIIALTSFASSPLAKAADVALISISEEISFRPEAVASTVSQISLLDALFMMYGMKMKNVSEGTLSEIRKVSRFPYFLEFIHLSYRKDVILWHFLTLDDATQVLIPLRQFLEKSLMPFGLLLTITSRAFFH